MLRIIPVIDLKGGLAVQAAGGDREKYQPVRSVLCGGAEPEVVAAAMAELCGAAEIYVADLDAIQRKGSNAASIERIASNGQNVWLDAGLATSGEVERVLARHERVHAVIGLETLASLAELSAMIGEWGEERLVFSLDMKAGRPLGRPAICDSHSPLELAGRAAAAGFRRLIVLDLAAVGRSGGPPYLPLCCELANALPAVELIAGGGVRGMADLMAAEGAGCGAALVATALHRGRISEEHLLAGRFPVECGGTRDKMR